MPIVTTRTPSTPAHAPRDVWQAMRRGALGRCPHCGQGHLFAGFLTVAPSCDHCATEFHHHRADDLPAYIVIAIVGHVVVGGMLSAETYAEWPLWWHVVLWPSLTIALSLVMIRPIKGAVVALQWAFRMHGFGSHPDGDEMPALRPRAEDA